MNKRFSYRWWAAFTVVGFVLGVFCGVSFGGAEKSSKPISIVAFGDSTTAPRTVGGKPLTVYADILKRELPGKGIDAVVINAGVGGNTTALAKKRFEKDVLSHVPQFVIIQFGINDSAVDVWKKPPATKPRVAVEAYEKNLRSFIRTLREGKAQVILMTPNPLRWTDRLKRTYGKPPYRPDDPDGFNVLLKQYADAVRRIGRKEKVPLVDVYAAFEAYGDKDGQSIDDLLLDGMHPNARGQRFVADMLIEQIGKMKAALASGAENAPVAEKNTNRRPNILIAISDDQSYPHASAYGCRSVRTPAFDRIAAEGVLFTNAFAASPGCSPSRAALLTGRYPWQLEHAGTHASSFSARYVTFPDLLDEAGYFIGYTGKGWGPGNFKEGGRGRNPAGPAFHRHKIRDRPAGVSNKDYAANFEYFLSQRPAGKPFCFWYGGHEPHRSYEKGVGLKNGGKLDDVVVPPFLSDTPEVRSDILDYAFEIEWFDRHLGRMIRALEKAGELDNTIIIVTSDNGMPFPRAKANVYEHGIHMPLAIRWGGKISGGRVVDDLVSLIDLAPTILEAVGVEHPSEKSRRYPMSGRSLMNILGSDKQGVVDPTRTAVFSARERHSSSRYKNLAYPQRCIRTRRYLYIRNFRPERWPAGAPQKYEKDGTLGPMHGGYHDIDACPTLTYLIEHRDDAKIGRFFHLAVDKRPTEELYDVLKDPGCLNNLAESPAVADVKEKLAARFEAYLRETKDLRILDGGEVFETYKRYSRIRKFPPPKNDGG